MRWECSECGCRFERPRPPPVCGECGTAGAVFMKADRELEEDLDSESVFDSWLRRGLEARPPVGG